MMSTALTPEIRMDSDARGSVRLVGGHEVLSHRETEVLCLVARGLANKHIARELGVSTSSVKTQVSGVLSKLGLQSRTQLALYPCRRRAERSNPSSA